jgi:hypothetical protein
MTISINMLAPNAAANAQYQCQSGNSYTSDAYGIIPAVLPRDVSDLVGQDCIALGQSGGRSLFSAIAAPVATNDVTQDFVVGSQWLDTTHNIKYECINNAKNSAVWMTMFSSAAIATVTSAQALTSFAAVPTTAAISASAYGFTSAQANGIISLLNALRAVAVAEGVTGP